MTGLPVDQKKPAISPGPRSSPFAAVTYYSRNEERDADQAPLELGLIRRIAAYTKPYALKRNALFVLTFLRGLQLPTLAWMIGHTISGPVANRDARGIGVHAAAYFGLALFMIVTLHFRYRFALELGESVAHDMRAGLFAKLMTMPMSFFNRTKFGRLISRFTSDIDSIRLAVQDVAFVMVVQGMQMAVSTALMAWYDVKLFALMAILAPLIWCVNRVYRRQMSVRVRRVQESWSRVTSTLSESVNGVRVTQAFVRQEINLTFFRDLIGEHSQNNLGVAQASAVFVPLLQLKSQLFLGAMALLGGYGVLRGEGWLHMNVGEVVMFFFLANLFFEPVQAIGNQLNQALTAMAGAERLFRFLDERPEWSDASTGRAVPAIRGHVRFQAVDFEYVPGRPVLKDISFEVQPGQTVALVGQTGSGKSTIIGLLQKLYLPLRGSVSVDGEDLGEIAGDSLRAQMGSVQQNNFLFTGSVLDNIRFTRPQASESDVRTTLRSLDCLDLFEALSDKLDTRVAERGASLSFGQRQLVCFARALLADPRIVVLDEATSAIDTVTEVRLQRALEVLLRGRTAFVVAHRLSTIRKADLVLVLDQGKIVERGTHDSLLQQGGIYSRLHREFVGRGD
jgi:ATP-binding cassette subfamily B protein